VVSLLAVAEKKLRLVGDTLAWPSAGKSGLVGLVFASSEKGLRVFIIEGRIGSSVDRGLFKGSSNLRALSSMGLRVEAGLSGAASTFVSFSDGESLRKGKI
jgi:hypothetical protein